MSTTCNFETTGVADGYILVPYVGILKLEIFVGVTVGGGVFILALLYFCVRRFTSRRTGNDVEGGTKKEKPSFTGILAQEAGTEKDKEEPFRRGLFAKEKGNEANMSSSALIADSKTRETTKLTPAGHRLSRMNPNITMEPLVQIHGHEKKIRDAKFDVSKRSTVADIDDIVPLAVLKETQIKEQVDEEELPLGIVKAMKKRQEEDEDNTTLANLVPSSNRDFNLNHRYTHDDDNVALGILYRPPTEKSDDWETFHEDGIDRMERK
ncbi:hypothetical protein O9G_003718 [Rozella allomycis CSF55]|uniref:Uncharacterized protein n=1 Tax=Rozella allomycis (strain CSF55) TaxID=988480 RepID=A0A075AWA2_ROZAC|nr:hypothetical protein O9G_003718 [Rozella allomycis CSF55]|eukprot:EPZ32987.1 hypothetical protein O9G_003718 [Rozella allomycis CSF55]